MKTKALKRRNLIWVYTELGLACSLAENYCRCIPGSYHRSVEPEDRRINAKILESFSFSLIVVINIIIIFEFFNCIYFPSFFY